MLFKSIQPLLLFFAIILFQSATGGIVVLAAVARHHVFGSINAVAGQREADRVPCDLGETPADRQGHCASARGELLYHSIYSVS